MNAKTAPEKIASQVISANRLGDGLVVYFGPQGSWVEKIAAAHLYAGQDEARAALERAREDVKKGLILDPFLVEVTVDAAGISARKLRDAIRAKGPTINYARHS